MAARRLVSGTSIFKLALVSLGALLFLGAGEAEAYQGTNWFAGTHSPADQEAIVNYGYDLGPQGVTAYPGPPVSTGQALADALASEAHSAAHYGALAAESETAATGTGLLPEVAAAVPTIAAAGGAFLAGWEIGEGINAKFLHIGLDDGSASSSPTSCYSQACGAVLEWRPQGFPVYDGTVQQSPGAYLYGGKLNGAWFNPVRWFAEPCPFSGFDAPQGSRLQTGVPTGSLCAYGPAMDQFTDVFVTYPYVLKEDVLGRQTIHSYDPSTDGSASVISPAPSDPGVPTVRQRLEDLLNGADQDLHRAWIDWRLEPASVPEENPVNVGADPGNDDPNQCALSNSSASHDPDTGAQNPDDVVHTFAAARDPLTEQPAVVHLYWGRLSFGYRHIVYRRGWGPTAEAYTAAALATDLSPDPQRNGTSFRYHFNYQGAGGAGCRWRVVVEYGADHKDPQFQDQPKHIITAIPIRVG